MADDDFQVAESPTTPPAKKTAAKRATAAKTTEPKTTAKKAATKRTAAKKVAEPVADAPTESGGEAPAKKVATRKTAAKKTAAVKTAAEQPAAEQPVAAKTPTVTTRTRKSTGRKAAAAAPVQDAAPAETREAAPAPSAEARPAVGMVLFQPPEPTAAPTRRTRTRTAAQPAEQTPDISDTVEAGHEVDQDQKPAQRSNRRPAKKAAAKPVQSDEPVLDSSAARAETDQAETDEEDENDTDGAGRRRRRRGGRRRRKPGDGESTDSQDSGEDQGGSDSSGNRDNRANRDDSEDSETGGDGTSRRRRRRRRPGDDGGEGGSDDPTNTVTRVRRQRSAEDEITSISGSTRLEAKKQRRRDGREAGRRRAPIVSEAEFLARRESVDRVMVIRQSEDLTQIGVLEDKVLVEHYVARESQTSLIGNVYLGRVQNVLPSMEAAFIDIGKGRNAVLYAGEVNWSAMGHRDGGQRKIESVLSSGQPILVQVTKDPIGNKGARLTSQVSLAGRFLVYVPDGTTSGISRKLPDTERNRLKTLLKEIVPDTAGVIVRTAAEGASEDELTRDVERLKARWEDIEAKVKGNAPQLLYGEPDLTLKVVRDLFTEDFAKLVIEGDDAWDTVTNYVAHVAPDLQERVERFDRSAAGKDIFATYRVEEQIAKGLDRKVWLPSGGSLVIDRTEAMTVVDVNTGKFTGSGGNLEETVTKNNLEAAEEIVRQLRLRDIGGIIVVDFIDMVLESNRDLVLRRLVECLGRDRTRHQVAEVTSLGLVQMTRKRIGTGLVESFSENCSHCQGRGVVIQDTPVEPRTSDDGDRRGGGGGGGNAAGGASGGGRRTRGGRGRSQNDDNGAGNGARSGPPSPKDVAAIAKHEPDQEESTVLEPLELLEPLKIDQEVDRAADQAAEQGPDEAQAPRVQTRSRRRGAGRSTVVTPVEPSADESPFEAAPEPEAAVVPEPEPVEPTQPQPPRVVTRTRRSTSRTALAPAAAAAEPVEMAVVPEPVAVVPVVEEQRVPVTAPEPPKVITRTRGRSATRAAGPPATSSSAGSAAESGIVSGEPGSDEDSPDGDPGHVPIKKKGTRKR